MSRIGKLPITVPAGVEIKIQDGLMIVKGPKGELKQKVHPRIKVSVEDGVAKVERQSEDKFDRSLHGLTRSLLANMVEGVTNGYSKRLEIIGVGYRAAVQGKKLNLSLGFSHPVDVPAPEGITFEIDKEKKNIIIITGIDKELVGQIAANVRGLRKPEPYKGKGIRYEGEHVRRKAGKAATAAK
ncbi:50S ribosomal protein L6 [Candidatus Peregrinibacteria bacterium CG11_big_fil_rev_8_21_14_0_20_46_8]|nr:MAG: 50S ribosomal protein L6 [Candidatus Peregrinibacteria bacterium CG11_big_fil_rev_8_21_14_0_20_46_8]